MSPDREVMPSSEAARFVGVSKTTLIKWAERGVIPGFRIEGRWWFRRRELERWLDGAALPAALDGRNYVAR